MSVRGQKSLRKVDTLRFEIANSGGRELYALPGDSSFRDESLTDSVKGGLVTTGDFSAHAREIFAGSFTQVQFEGSERLEGIDALKWSFRVPKFASTWTLLIGRAADIPDSVGYFWADPVSDDVLRFEVRAAQLPAGFPARDIVRRVDYSRVKVGDRDAWLPEDFRVLAHRQLRSPDPQCDPVQRLPPVHCEIEYPVRTNAALTIAGPSTTAQRRPQGNQAARCIPHCAGTAPIGTGVWPALSAKPAAASERVRRNRRNSGTAHADAVPPIR